MDRSGNTIAGGFRLKLLGVLYAGPVRQQEGQIKVVPIPTVNVPIAVTPTMTNLGFVIRAEELLDFEPILKGASIILPSS